MGNNEHDQAPLSSNPFIASSQQINAELNQWGLDEFEYSWERHQIKLEAEKCIRQRNITDESEKQRVYDEVKAQYREYMAYNASRVSSKEKYNTAEPAKITEPTVIDDETEYRRGYDACVAYFKELEEQKSTPNSRGWSDAYNKIIRNKEIAAMEVEEKQEEILKEQGKTMSLNDLLENNAITQLRDEVKKIDERLRKLERYTEE